MSNYLLDEVVELKTEWLNNGTWLVIHKLHRTPYHIGILVEDDYLSLTVHGILHKTRNEIIHELQDKAYNNLIIELKVPKGDINNLRNFFENPLNEVDFNSCLFPVRNYLSRITSNNSFSTANNLFELLDVLKAGNFIGRMMATRMNFAMEGKIVLERYSQDAIVKHIKRLKELKDREKTSNNI